MIINKLSIILIALFLAPSLSACSIQSNTLEYAANETSTKELRYKKPPIEEKQEVKSPTQPALVSSVSSKKAKPKPLICIEAGHQKKANLALEQDGPNSKNMKYKVSGGTRGAAIGKPESELTLEVALKLESALKKDYRIKMVRKTQNVNISNKERAEQCNAAKANLVIRIHADGSTSKNTKGMTFFYPAPNNPNTRAIYKESSKIAGILEKNMTKSTSASSNGVKQRADLTGFNWTKVPSVLIEMGFMTNPEEDRKMNTPEYQSKMVNGMKRGLNSYFFK